ncbi:hypothetical protein VTI74DRAFT_3869 [Chaetomium olivicolor]
MAELPNGLIPFGPDANCTLDTCPLEVSILQYRPSQAASGTFIAVFGLSMIVHAYQGVRTRSWGFMASMLCGCSLEIAGYAGRLVIYDNPFHFGGFLTQIVCITVAPVFFCSAIYVLLSQVINHVDRSLSRFKPEIIYWIFISCDIASLILQAVGGAYSCVGSTKADIQVGVDISLAGLIFQVITLVIFCALFADYLIACKRLSTWKRIGKPVKTLLTFLFLSILLISLRCVYRIVELHEGYFSELFRDEPLFIALESVVMCIAVLCLNFGHPGSVLGISSARNHSGKLDHYSMDLLSREQA